MWTVIAGQHDMLHAHTHACTHPRQEPASHDKKASIMNATVFMEKKEKKISLLWVYFNLCLVLYYCVLHNTTNDQRGFPLIEIWLED